MKLRQKENNPRLGFPPRCLFQKLYDHFCEREKRSDASGDPADVSRYPVMLLDIQRCPHFSVNASNFTGTFLGLLPLATYLQILDLAISAAQSLCHC